jgi:hypothetical protein
VDGDNALRRANWDEAKAAARAALDAAGVDTERIGSEAQAILSIADTRSGDHRSGARASEEALRGAEESEDQQFQASIRLSVAEAALAAGNAESALHLASLAIPALERAGRLESAWRARLICGLAEVARRRTEAAGDHLRRAAVALGELERRWGEEAFAGYRSRPDVQEALHRLEKETGDPLPKLAHAA